MTPGSTPATADPSQRAMGFKSNSSAFSMLMSKIAAAPSLIPLELPAVTVPPFLKAGFSLASFSILVSRTYSPFSCLYRGCSSIFTFTGSPFRCGTAIGIISSLNLPLLMASTARRWLSSAKVSCSSRVMSLSPAMFSAVSPRLTIGNISSILGLG